MHKKLSALLIFLISALCAHAQLTVAEECKEREGDITAYRLNDNDPILVDGDTIPFALVRVGFAEPNATFDSKWVLKQEFKDNEYWVYFMEGVKSVSIKTKRFAPLHYKFPQPLAARSTYAMTLHKPDEDKYKGTLRISSNVADAEVYIDGLKVSDGTPFTYTSDGGVHHIELKAAGYAPQARDVETAMGQEKNIAINLYAEGSLDVDGISYGVVPVNATQYNMGSTLNYYTQPVRSISLRPFSVGSNLVSVELWNKVMGTDKPGSAEPVTNVSYDEVIDFIAALNEKTGREYRLPTEAEWEYLATNKYQLGIDDIKQQLEWCSDWFGKYSLTDTTNPRGPEEGVLRVVRGGTGYDDADPVYYDVTYRWHNKPDDSSSPIGFRLVED